ncbi:SURF1 family protein [Brachybacterium sp. FME24]|uniref:SURF1 family cytochrome oxidase biogenesis protein n=1 Tax=Brachybacterium sp. FME24 TaxID=2742605 RepID=UPI00186811F7|nr:SURF1 family protein [Brachybacterium sp. FME24]
MTAGSSRRSALLGRDSLLGLLGVTLAFALCVGLGFWQFGRFEDRRDSAAVIDANHDAPPVALSEVLPSPDAPLAATDDWTPVALDGRYCTDPECVLYVRNRQVSGQVGFWQLVPFRADEGTTVLVVRGWVGSQGTTSAPADPPPVPEGELAITVRLRPAEPMLDRENPPGQVHSVNPPQIAELLPEDDSVLVDGAYGDLAEEDPASPRPAALPEPDTSLGPHLSYAFQWWVFALFFPVAWIYRTRRTLQDLDTDDDPYHDPDDEERRSASHDTTAHRPRRATHSRRRSQDEEEEDALIDHQGH